MTASRQFAGVACGLLAYGMWGFFPLFFRQLANVPPVDVLSNRALWACLWVGLLITVSRHWSRVRAVLRNPNQALTLLVAAALIGTNWLVFLWAVASGQVMASSLGYFLTPLVNVVLGLVVLDERLDRLEGLAVILALAAIVNEVVAVGSLPWISLVLAGTFGSYGLVRKRLPVDVVSGLWLETLAMLPACALYALWQAQHGHAVFTGHDLRTTALLVASGVLTALPLIAFAAAAQRLDLATVGMLMYINPTTQFITAIHVFGEPMRFAQLFSFALIWLGLVLFSWSAWSKYRRARQAS
ncbi:EamA family transporter RarD [Accumulibacter sp.]|uniref:EamA family transporter RarD n=1 Tax=Accumulibacter sp. TaxID=2053492 RepID=UPI0025D92747|nr:EamA family transporter RarD [Accumulibacter sp.]MCM8625559.1 EamA family transporter RarD [Accumulibacter sp.]